MVLISPVAEKSIICTAVGDIAASDAIFAATKGSYEGLLRTKYRICIYPCYVAYMNAMRNKSISKHVRYKLKVSDKTKRCLTQLKDAW